MQIKPSKNRFLYIFCICSAFILINSTIVLTFSNEFQLVFSQGYIPPPSNNPKPQSFICGQTAFNGPSYRGPDGCPAQCPTTGDNIPTGCPVNPIGKGEDIHIGNQSGQTQTNTLSGSDCPLGVQSIVACNFGQTQGQSENNSSCNTAACAAGGGSVGNDRFCDLLPCTTPQTTTSTTSCLTTPQNITSALQAAICGLSNTQPGSCPPGVQSIVACNFGQTPGQARE